MVLKQKPIKMKTLNNTVIKNLTPEMGKRIIQKYKDDGGGILVFWMVVLLNQMKVITSIMVL